MAAEIPEGVLVEGAMLPGFETVLTREALAFLADLHRRFDGRRLDLLATRAARQRRLDAGERPDFLRETAAIRDGDWTVAPLPADLLDRRVEITGPVDRKMIVNALNSGASVFMADFEDASTPTWRTMVEGQANLAAAVRRAIDFQDPQSGRDYRLADKTAVLFVRPRGWHLAEKHVLVDGQPIAGALFDFGLHVFHNARELLARGSGPYFYLPKLESHHEARLWNDVFVHAQTALGVPQGSIKATVLIETILATFEMDEILWELRDHSAGLNCGRWDYIFSFIKKFREQPWAVLPDRGQVGMTVPFLRSYSQLVIRTCHRRGVHAMGGMAAQIPIKNDAAANEAALERVRADKKREASDGHDGTWVAHPGLVAIARAEFDAVMKGPNQIARKRQDVVVSAADLITVPKGSKTEAGLRQNVAVGIGYVEAWLRGIGCVPLFNLMEDAATAEISRAQLWQWLRHGQALDDGRPVTRELVQAIVREENDKVRAAIGDEAYGRMRHEQAAGLLLELVESPDFAEFLTLPAYERLLADERAPAAEPAPPPTATMKEDTMKAAYIEGFGGPEVLVYGDLPAPVAGPGQVVVDLVAASINGADPKVCAGDYKQTAFPLVLGRDFSGVVRAVGPDVADLQVGDEVFGVLETGRDGTYCEQIAVGAAVVARKPAALSHDEAAALALVGLTAICAIEETLKLQAGETILVQGGAGGVASFAIQLAKHLGAHVVSTASTGNLDYVRGLGADEVIDYTTTDFTAVVKDCDAVFETVGGDVATRSFAVLKPGGRAAFIASGAQAPVPERGDVVALRPAVPRLRRHLERIVALVEQGAVRLPQITTYPLAAAREALEISAARHLRGKLVLKIR